MLAFAARQSPLRATAAARRELRHRGVVSGALGSRKQDVCLERFIRTARESTQPGRSINPKPRTRRRALEIIFSHASRKIFRKKIFLKFFCFPDLTGRYSVSILPPRIRWIESLKPDCRMPKSKARTPALDTSARKPKSKSSDHPAAQSHHPPSAADATVAHVSFGTNGQTTTGTLSAGPSAARSLEIAEKIKELVRLAQEQGYLTYSDINERCPDSVDHAGGAGRDLHQAAQSRSRDRGPGRGGPRQAAGAGRGGRQVAAGYPGRSGPDVSQADGPGAAADPRAGSRDLQAHRRRRERSQAHHLQLRLRRQGTHRPGGKADLRAAQGTL